MDRIDLRVDVPAVTAADIIKPASSERSADVAKRVARARAIQEARYAERGLAGVSTNARCSARLIEDVAAPDAGGRALLSDAAEKMRFSATAYHRVLKVARTIADLDGVVSVEVPHIEEAAWYRSPMVKHAALAS